MFHSYAYGASGEKSLLDDSFRWHNTGQYNTTVQRERYL